MAKKHGAEEYCKVGQQCNYFEATLMHIHIKDVLKNWKNENEYFISKIRNITEDFIKAVENTDKQYVVEKAVKGG
ncbi:MAG: hypothetical protein MJ250_07510 [Alphaproteobacteria bacterium]|nr:hypothetical protein [Alphaproteobacteria bacterium]